MERARDRGGQQHGLPAYLTSGGGEFWPEGLISTKRRSLQSKRAKEHKFLVEGEMPNS